MATRTEVYSKFGQAAEAAQLLETELTTILLALEGLDKGWHLDPSPLEGGHFLAKLGSKTMGRLIGQLKKQLDVEESELLYLRGALAARNRLMHGFYEQHNFRIQTPDGRDIMLKDLEEIHQALFEAWQTSQLLSEILLGALKLLKKKETSPEGDAS